jgi:histidinol-phosphate aminotransferase
MTHWELSRLFQPHIAHMSGYVPGEQPREGAFLKLNTNENPYPPSPKALEAMRAAVDDWLRLYPDPLATEVRRAAAELHQVEPDWILVGNGSDDLLTIITRAFVGQSSAVVFPTPSYVLYRTLVELQNARPIEVAFEHDWSLNAPNFAAVASSSGARLAFLANPNSPSGTALSAAHVADLASRLECPLVVDEAYVDFADAHCARLPIELPNVIVCRTLSKGYSLAGLRLGYLIAQPAVVEELVKLKDSYNCDRLSVIGGAAALRDQTHLQETRAKVCRTRAAMMSALRGFGYQIPPSQANFAWCVGGPPATDIYAALRSQGILVRLMRYAGQTPALRISVGTDAELQTLLDALSRILG